MIYGIGGGRVLEQDSSATVSVLPGHPVSWELTELRLTSDNTVSREPEVRLSLTCSINHQCLNIKSVIVLILQVIHSIAL